jgi:hypothetical protein
MEMRRAYGTRRTGEAQRIIISLQLVERSPA